MTVDPRTFMDPDMPDSITLRVEHVGPKPAGDGSDANPSTISEEAMAALIQQFIAFVGGRILVRLENGESVEHVVARIDLTLSDTVEEDPLEATT